MLLCAFRCGRYENVWYNLDCWLRGFSSNKKLVIQFDFVSCVEFHDTVQIHAHWLSYELHWVWLDSHWVLFIPGVCSHCHQMTVIGFHFVFIDVKTISIRYPLICIAGHVVLNCFYWIAFWRLLETSDWYLWSSIFIWPWCRLEASWRFREPGSFGSVLLTSGGCVWHLRSFILKACRCQMTSVPSRLADPSAHQECPLGHGYSMFVCRCCEYRQTSWSLACRSWHRIKFRATSVPSIRELDF